MTTPSNDKESLGIVQSYIVFQFCLFSPKSFSVEIAISDTTKTKRRLMFSSCTKDVVVNPLHCRIPMGKIPIGEWVNLSFDILSFVSECFKSQTFRSIDHISLSGNCKIKRVFSMRSPLVESNTIQINSEFKLEYAEMLPKSLQICIGHTDINMNIDRVKSRNNETSFDQGDNNVMIANANVKPTSNVIPSNMVGFGYNPNPLNHKNSPQMSGNEKNLKSKSQMKELRNKQEFLKVPQKQKWKPPHKVSPVKKMDTNKSDSNGRKLLNTLKHMDKWESIDANGNVNGSGHDSIEEIYDIDEHRHSPVKEMTTHTVAKYYSI